MGRAPCCDKASVKKGPWSPEEDVKLKEFIDKHGTGGNWIALPHKAGLKRCGKSCRLRWLNYLRPNIKHGDFSDDEDRIICSLFTTIGSRWSIIAAQLPGRTDNDIKNYWNTKLKKKLIMGLISIGEIRPNPAMVSSNFSQASSPSPPTHMAANVWSFTGPAATPSSSCNNGLIGINNMQLQPYYYDHIQENILSFGGEQASCSSSDGSSGCNHLGYGGGEMDYDYGSCGGSGGSYENRGQMGNFQNLFYGGGVEDDQQKVMVLESGVMKKEGGCSEKQSGVWKEETPLEYSLEEINRLISSNSSSNCSNNNNVSFDELNYKSGEKFMYYYY